MMMAARVVAFSISVVTFVVVVIVVELDRRLTFVGWFPIRSEWHREESFEKNFSQWHLVNEMHDKGKRVSLEANYDRSGHKVARRHLGQIGDQLRTIVDQWNVDEQRCQGHLGERLEEILSEKVRNSRQVTRAKHQHEDGRRDRRESMMRANKKRAQDANKVFAGVGVVV